MGLNTRGETEQVRKPKQTHTKTTTKHNHQNPQQPAKTKAPNVYVSPALSTRSRRRNPGVIEQRRACGGVAKCEGLPDHQNHHHEATGATKVSTESCKSKKDSKVTDQHGQVPGTQQRKGKVQIGQLSQGRGKASTRPMVVSQQEQRMQDQPRAPHGGQPVEQPRATADTTCGSIIEARPKFPTPHNCAQSDHIPK